MDRKTEELIALGVSYALNCRPCMEYHKNAAVAAGAAQEEMLEAIRVAEKIKIGAGGKTKEYAGDLGFTQAERCCPPGSSCCP